MFMGLDERCSCKKSVCDICNNSKNKRKNTGTVPAPKRLRSRNEPHSGLSQNFKELTISKVLAKESHIDEGYISAFGEELHKLGTSVKDHENRIERQADMFVMQQEELEWQRQELFEIRKELRKQNASLTQELREQNASLTQELREQKASLNRHETTLFRHDESIKTNEISIDGLSKCLHAQSQVMSKQASVLNQQLKCLADSIQSICDNQDTLRQTVDTLATSQAKKFDKVTRTVDSLAISQAKKLDAVTALSEQLLKKELKVNLESDIPENVEDMESDSGSVYEEIDETSVIQAKYSPQISGSNNSIHFHLDAHNANRMRLPPSMGKT